jgi:hypothetical protein
MQASELRIPVEAWKLGKGGAYALRSANPNAIHEHQSSMNNSLRDTNPEKFAALTAEAQAPFRSLRMFIYGSCVVSAGVGGVIIFLGILAGRDLATAIPNFAVNAGVVALMTWLYLREQKAKTAAIAAVQAEMAAGRDPRNLTNKAPTYQPPKPSKNKNLKKS